VRLSVIGGIPRWPQVLQCYTKVPTSFLPSHSLSTSPNTPFVGIEPDCQGCFQLRSDFHCLQGSGQEEERSDCEGDSGALRERVCELSRKSRVYQDGL
jgi:hypothetical protein